MTEVLVIQAWCDPKHRTVRLSWDDIWVGLFCVDDDTIAYGTAEGIVIDVPRSHATVKWMRGGWALGSRFELQTPDGLYRFYLNRPHPSAPTLEPSLFNDVAGFLSGGGQLLSLVDGTLGTFGSVAGPIGDVTSSIAILSGARAGIRNAEALRARLASAWVRGWNGVPAAELGPVTATMLFAPKDETLATAVCFSPDGQWVASAHSDNTVRVTDAATGGELWRVAGRADAPADATMTDVAFDATGTHLAAASDDGWVYVVDAEGVPEWELTHPDDVGVVAWDPDGTGVATVCYDGSVWLWMLTKGAEATQAGISLSEDAASLHVTLLISPDGGRLVVSPDGRSIEVRSRAVDDEPTLWEDVVDTIAAAAFHPDGNHLAVADLEGPVVVLDVRDGTIVLRFDCGEGARAICFSPDGTLIATGDYDGVHLWAASDGEPMLTIADQEIVDDIAFGPDGRTLAAAALSGLIVWELSPA